MGIYIDKVYFFSNSVYLYLMDIFKIMVSNDKYFVWLFKNIKIRKKEIKVELTPYIII